MSLMTHPVVVRLRNVLRSAGLTRPLARLRAGKDYEAAVDAALLETLRSGDVVWDVGANIGFYTEKMAGRVGAQGHIFAFEPSPVNFARLANNCAALPNVTALALGLSSAAGRAGFVQGEDALGATSRLAAGGGPEHVELWRGDDLVSAGRARVPDVLKIDVEGHEYDVIEGLSATLADRRLRALVMEVHFGLLAQAGRSDVPGLIEGRLAAAGFGVRWIGSSHLHAVRPSRSGGA